MMINREAADKTKGFRLQKIRVIEYMLDGIATCEKPLFYSSIEHIEDLYVKNRSDDGEELLEEDKNYDPDSSFTFNSDEVVNSMVSFIDIWLKYQFSDNLKISFYSTNNLGKERSSKVVRDNAIQLPDKPILELLSNKEYDYPDLLPAVKKFVIAEYKVQYDKPGHPGRITLIENWSEADWKKFLACLDWKFGEFDEVAKKQQVLEKIRNCKHFSTAHSGKEESIFAQLMEMYDERQHIKDPTEKFIHSSEIEIEFLRACSDPNYLLADPVWQLWSMIPPSDSRNIKDKITDACTNYNEQKIGQHALKVARSLIEQNAFLTDKSLLSLKYRIFEHCRDYLLTYMDNRDAAIAITEQEIDQLLKNLVDEGNRIIGELSTQYRYTHNNPKLIDGLILELFDSCYLAFD